MPWSMLCRSKPVANIPGLSCKGVFYPKGSLKESQLWCFTRKHKAFLTLALEHGSYKGIVLGMSKEQAAEWSCKLSDVIGKHNGNNPNN